MTPIETCDPEGVRIDTVETTEITMPPQQPDHPLGKVFGVFKGEPLMDALMKRVREDRRAELLSDTAEQPCVFP